MKKIAKRPDFGRHAGFVGPATLDGTLHIVGCGATGSYVAECAARMGFTKFSIWDADVVEPHNLANQRYEPSHIGRPKVEALAEVLQRFNPDIEVTVHNEFFTEESIVDEMGPLVLTTDSMSSRETIMKAAANNALVDNVFETRLGFSYGEARIVNNLNPEEVQDFLNTIVPDDSIPEGPCNLRICTTLVQLMSSYVVHQLCEMYASRNSNKKWTKASHAFIEMQPILQSTPIKHNKEET